MIDLLAGDGAPPQAEGGGPPVPSPARVLPLRESVGFPGTMMPLAIGQPRSIELVNDALTHDRLIVMIASRDGELEEPPPDQLYDVGVVGVIARMLKAPDGTLRILVQCAQRVRVARWVREKPYLVAEVTEAPDVVEHSTELVALARNVQGTFGQIVESVPYLPEELQVAVANIDDPAQLSHLIAGSLRLQTAERQELLEQVDVALRLRRIAEILARELEVIQIGSRIQSQVQGEIEGQQREFFLRQQLKAIQEELGEKEPAEAEVDELREQLDAIELPPEVRRQVDRELSRLERLPQAAAEHGVVRGWLEWVAELPWTDATKDNLDLAHARGVLDDDHFGLERVKDRILEFLAVRKLKPDARGSILCFAGPPGVGKTSLGRSIARALGREFERISVGGVRDEAEIRGHRRTYIGAMPGVIIRALRDAGSRNPLFMIDEIDKMGADFRGDPASAMLEVLDPEQNATFRDHYLDVPFDLSDVMFIATANTLDTIPAPLLDRMEVIQLAGYTEEEKLQIAKRYLVPRQVERNGLKRSQIGITDKALRVVISDYTREAGVRQLEREIGSICRKVARQVAEGGARKRVSVSEPRVRELLGRRRFFTEARRRTRAPGVATGLAWTPVGGDVLFIEATAMAGSGKLTITGQLGDVMKESAQAALSWVRGQQPDGAWFREHDIHIHVPAGAIPKDGPSAGITMATALMSLVSGRTVRHDVAMTGEITLTGEVLPIGGLKEKALAAQRAGIRRVIAPALNAQDVEDIPEHLRRQLEFHFVERIEDVLDLALESRRRPAASPRADTRRNRMAARG
ncbi:MAG TPA: endopeptidase La [Solirubrobacteraceae bacterium]|nr:endopeptidase La [Solirubrobacteraceae bacterium]